jgi:acetyl-CoA acyltransferase 1
MTPHSRHNKLLSSPDNGGPPQSELISSNPSSKDCRERMGWTSENVAVDFNISREEQDDFAARSFQRAEHAQRSGYFYREIVPFTVYHKDPLTGERKEVLVTEDDGIRYGTTKEALQKIKPAFPQWGNGTTTGGNASQITDGAAAVLLMKRRKATELGLTILGKHVTTAIAGMFIISFVSLHLHKIFLGVPPRIMGIGPVFAIPMALKNCGLTLDDVDLFEVCSLLS